MEVLHKLVDAGLRFVVVEEYLGEVYRNDLGFILACTEYDFAEPGIDFGIGRSGSADGLHARRDPSAVGTVCTI